MDIFEKAMSETEKGVTFNEYQTHENAIEWIQGSNVATVTLCRKKLVNKVKRYAEKYPDLFQIISEQEGAIVAHIPVNTVKIQYIEPREIPEEQRRAARERLLAYQEKKRREQEEMSDDSEDELIDDIELYGNFDDDDVEDEELLDSGNIDFDDTIEVDDPPEGYEDMEEKNE